MGAITQVDTALAVEEAEAAVAEIEKRLIPARNALQIAEGTLTRTTLKAVTGDREAAESRFDAQQNVNLLRQEVEALESALAEAKTRLTQAKREAHGAVQEEHRLRALELAEERGKLGDELQALLHRAGELYQKIGTLGPQIRVEWRNSGRSIQFGNLTERRLLELLTQELRTAGVPVEGAVPCRGVAMGPPPPLGDELKADHERFFTANGRKE